MGESCYSQLDMDKRTPFGKEMAKHFLFEAGYRNMNHGSFGTIPRSVQINMRELQSKSEARPDQFIRYDYPVLLDESREAIATMLNVPVDTIVFVPNATTGVNTVLRNLSWNPDGRDEIIFFDFIYAACGKTIDYVCEANLDLLSSRKISMTLPFSDEEILSAFEEAIISSKESGHHPRLAVFDTIVSMPGIRLPFEKLTETCAKHDVLSLIDGAHGLGHIPLDLTALKPDFFTSNAHKWLFVPRGCAIFYVPEKHQSAMRSTLPTSHGFIPRGAKADRGPLPKSSNSAWVSNFEFVGTIDSSPYLCIAAAIKFRNEVCGGEEAIREYTHRLAREGGQKVADILGTEILDNAEQTLSRCCLVNVALPIQTTKTQDDIEAEKYTSTTTTTTTTTITAAAEPGFHVPEQDLLKAVTWMLQVMMKEYNTFIPVIDVQGSLFVRLSAQIYLDLDDFVWTGNVLRELCRRVSLGEYKELEMRDRLDVVVGGDLAVEGTDSI